MTPVIFPVEIQCTTQTKQPCTGVATVHSQVIAVTERLTDAMGEDELCVLQWTTGCAVNVFLSGSNTVTGRPASKVHPETTRGNVKVKGFEAEADRGTQEQDRCNGNALQWCFTLRWMSVPDQLIQKHPITEKHQEPDWSPFSTGQKKQLTPRTPGCSRNGYNLNSLSGEVTLQ